ncbi:MAG: DNA starvation/stationary phase protection protein Dps [Thermoleophilia bacterium]|nr:DNA starvation/stationary phase protection protein Dps [Gaiellaceae bacterium]MDW8337692.1 DNA starvation/stationary phase protection protein Dps [Thermoleophilia bacterium]
MATTIRRTFETRHDLPAETRAKLVELLNARLADAFDLYSQLKQAHWNVKGSDFIQLHELYDEIAGSVLEHVDEIAERATALGGLALGTARMAAAASSLEEYPLDAVAGAETVAAIADRLAAFGASLRAAIDAATELGDQDTADLFIDVSRAIDKHLWFVEAHLQS